MVEIQTHASGRHRLAGEKLHPFGTIARYGVPEHLRSDNGPEFIASCMQDWLKAQEIKTLYIKPGSPWENGHIASFHDKLRDECLNRELFGNLRDARVILESWRVGLK